MRRALLASLVLSLLVPLGLVAQEIPSSALVLRPGDAVRISVWRQPELSGEFTISEAGTIQHPLYREIEVTGVPVEVARERVRAYLSRLEEAPQFVVEPLLRVSVGGEVRQPSLYRLSPGTSVAQAVAMAGGVSDRGNLERVRLFRDGEELEVDLTSPQAGLAQSSIRSGDQIFVARRVSLFRDYIAPAGSIVAATAAILNILLN